VNPDVVAALSTAAVSLVLGVLSFISAGRATRQHDDEDTPGGQAAGFYRDALADCRAEVARLRDQLDPPPHREDPAP
jgi:hypothetical protein